MKTSNRQSPDTTSIFTGSLSVRHPRRNILKGAVAGVAGSAAFGASALLSNGKIFASSSDRSAIQKIFDIAVTAERLAITTYSNGIANAAALGISGANLTFLQAALVEEQLHELFLEELGAQPLTSTFSYPFGAATFQNQSDFIATQQQLEGVSNSAYLAAVNDFALLSEPRLAQICAQMATIEAEHRVMGRTIMGNMPENNWAFTPIFLKSISDVPAYLIAAGYGSPTTGNSYIYQQVSTVFNGIDYLTPWVTESSSYSAYGDPAGALIRRSLHKK
jgi:Ferritin-like domain